MRVEIPPHCRHPWDVTPEEARAIQARLAARVREEPLDREVATVAGLDMGVRRERGRAVAVVLAVPSLSLVESAVWEGPVPFPYVPGLLSFREVPGLLRALEQLHTEPDLLFTDSQGRAHPRRLGLASHLGVLLDRPTIGVAKARLCGQPQGELSDVRGAWVPLVDRGQVIGAAVRTRPGAKPVYVSVGHRITLAEAVEWTLRCTTRYRLPEPTRLADRLSRGAGR